MIQKGGRSCRSAVSSIRSRTTGRSAASSVKIVTTSAHADSGATTSEQVEAVLAKCHPTTRTAHQPCARLDSAPDLALGERPAQALAARLLLPVGEEAGRGHLIGRTRGGMNIKLHAVTAAAAVQAF